MLPTIKHGEVHFYVLRVQVVKYKIKQKHNKTFNSTRTVIHF